MAQTEAASELVFKAILPEDIQWTELPSLPKSARLADIVDHPSQHAPFVIRVKVPGGTRVMPHLHPEHRIYTVISGVSISVSGQNSKKRISKPIRPDRSSYFQGTLRTSIGRSRATT